MLSLFDENHDFQITTEELAGNSLLAVLLTPDVDLFRANGKPGHDGVADALSFGIGFTVKTAVFTEPG
jgi:hypothetical protein